MLWGNKSPYSHLDLPVDADQEDIRQVYLQLRKELSGDDLRELYDAWDQIWSPRNRARTDALLLQVDETTPPVEELLDRLRHRVDENIDWWRFLREEVVLHQEREELLSLLIADSWLKLDFARFFPKKRPEPIEVEPRPEPALIPITWAPRPGQLGAPAAHAKSKTQRAETRVSESNRSDNTRADQTMYQVSGPRSFRPWERVTTAWRRLNWNLISLAVAALLLILAVVSQAEAIAAFSAGQVDSLRQRDAFSLLATDGEERWDLRTLERLNADETREISSETTQPVVKAVATETVIEDLEDDLEDTEIDTLIAISTDWNSIETRSAFQTRTADPATDEAADTSSDALPDAIEADEPLTTPIPPTATVTPTPTATVVEVPTPVTVVVQAISFTNIRNGPGVDYDVTELLQPGEQRVSRARSSTDDWLLVETEAGEIGWIYAPVVNTDGDLNQLPVVAAASE